MCRHRLCPPANLRPLRAKPTPAKQERTKWQLPPPPSLAANSIPPAPSAGRLRQCRAWPCPAPETLRRSAILKVFRRPAPPAMNLASAPEVDWAPRLDVRGYRPGAPVFPGESRADLFRREDPPRSEERRVGKECRSRRWPY